MNLDHAKQVVDLDEFLPPDGEDRVDLFYEEGSLRLEIFYESSNDQRESKRVIEFIHADHFIKSPFPGYSIFRSQQKQDVSLLNSLIEYEKSDWILTVYGDKGHVNRKHYRILFHSVGMALHVLCGSWKIYLARHHPLTEGLFFARVVMANYMQAGLSELSRVVSHALRHEPWLYELELDDAGWVSVDELLTAARIPGTQY